MNATIGYRMARFLMAAALAAILSNILRAEQSAELDPKVIADHATQTLKRVEKDGASWTTVIALPNSDASIEVSITQAGSYRTVVWAGAHGGKSQELCRVDERDGKWYVVESGRAGIYRPYEAPLLLPALYLFLAQSELRVADASFLQTAQFETASGNTATYRAPLPESNRQQLQQVLQNFDQMKRANPARITPEFELHVAKARELLEKGASLEVDAEMGIRLAGGAGDNRIVVKNFRWLSKDNPPPLAQQFDTAEDHTTSLLESVAALDDLLMIGHAGAWRPGGEKIDTEMVIVNTRSGQLRRVPYPGAGTGPGCFAKDRRSVFLSGLIPEEGGSGIFAIALDSGEVRRLGADTLNGITMFPTLSPDGRTLAAVTKSGKESGILEWQICLIDVDTDKVRFIGQPMDTAFLSWLPDGSGLVLVTRSNRDMNLPREDTIARIDLSGNITAIRTGSFPVVLGPQERILYLDRADSLWKTCNITGQDVTMVGDGLKGMNFPSLSPDSKWLVMMRFDPSTGPRPFFVEIATGKSVAISVRDGLWAFPSWR